MTKRVVAVVFGLFVLLPVMAQAQNPEVTAGVAFRVAADVDGVNTDGYRLYVNDVQVVDVPVTARANGVVTLDVPGQARGTHSIRVSAYNADKEAKSDPLIVTATLPLPGKPGRTRVIAIQIADDGTLTFKLVELVE